MFKIDLVQSAIFWGAVVGSLLAIAVIGGVL